MVVVVSCKEVKVDLEVIKNVSIDSHDPDKENKVEKAPPDGKGFLEICVGGEVYLEVYDDENYGPNNDGDSCQPEPQEKR